jgi:chromosome segregation protein
MEALVEQVDAAERELQKIQFKGEQSQEQIAQLESERDQSRSEFRNKSHSRNELHNQLGAIEARSAELIAQRAKLVVEQQQLGDQLAGAKEEVHTAQKMMEDAKRLASSFSQTREQLTGQRQSLISDLEAARKQEHVARDQRQAKQIELQRLTSDNASLGESIARLTTQLQRQSARREELAGILEDQKDPTEELRGQLQSLIESRLEVEKRLLAARDELNEFDNQMQSVDRDRVGFDRKSRTVRDSLEGVRIARQEVLVRRDTLAEQMEMDTDEIILLMQGLPEELTIAGVEQALSEIIKKVDRIGAVNLVAIEEHEQCAERKLYLDSQHADLTEAMATLEAAINKIDKETKSRFKDTFDSLNEGFKEFFPKLFGGGSAYLELTGNDMLSTGVGVMARPPGKRNSTIHLLSGGEKALTAVSLLFAFFELNPAPFCVLDEVDAPLDDANVERYAGVLKQLGLKTQLLFITHNKITMEASDILIGVTMAEPGVSRLVAVDVAEAAAMAAQ